MLLFTFLAAFIFIDSSIAGYVLEDDYSTSNFFNMFDFFTSPDPTHGFVSYVDQSTAQSAGLVSTSNGIYMGVDYTNQAPTGRSSVRLTSQKVYNSGSLVVLDLQHMPGGVCGTWPAFWTVGPNWPNGGEIDIIEGVNQQVTNDMTLHTSSGCSISNNNAFSGAIKTSNCDVNAFGQSTNAGCQVDTPNSATYGAGFNANGGGVYAMEWTDSEISIFFFQRGSVPSDISSGSPDPSTWGQPLAQFQGGCDIPQFFKDNQLVFDTTFCGDWAGATWGTSGCATEQYSTCEAFVAGNPSVFKEAYWQVNSLKVYQQGSSSSTSAPSSISDVPTPSVYVPVTTATSDEATTQPAITEPATTQPAITEAPTTAPVASPPVASSTASYHHHHAGNWPPSSQQKDADNSKTTLDLSGVANSTSSDDEPAQNAQVEAGGIVAENSSTATTYDAPALAAVVDAGGLVLENNELVTSPTGATRRSTRRSARKANRDTASSPELAQEWRARLQKEKLKRMRHVRNVGSHKGVFRH